MSAPRLRFPGFVGAWRTRKIGDFADVKTGARDTQDRVDGGAYPFFVRSDTIERINSYSFDGEAILTSGDGVGVGKNVHYINGRFDYHQRVYAIRDFSKDVDGKFFFQFFRENFLPRVMRLSAKNSVDSVRMSMITDMHMATPTLPEQKKIAAFLGVVDARIAALRARVLGLQTYKRGLMQALFSQSLRFTKQGGTAFPDWEEKRLGEVFDWIKTNNLSREFLNYEGGEVQNIHYGDIHTKFKANFAQDAEQVPFVSEGALLKDITDEEFCRLGDVVIADASEDYADVGKAIEIVQVRDRSLVAGLHTYIARPKGKMVALGFAGYLFRTAAMRKQVMWIAQGISVLGISKPNLSKLKLHLPHPDEQAKIAAALAAMDAKIAAVQLQVDKMQDFKKGLLQQMFV